MYTKVETSNENVSRAVANSAVQKKGKRKQSFGFMDNRPIAVAQHKLAKLMSISKKQIPPIQMQTKRTIPEFNPLKVPMHLPAIYTSTNFDNNHVVSAPTKTKAQTKRTNRGVKISTIIEPKKLNAAMENKKGELYASATSNDKVQLYIKANWDNAITSDKHNTCMTDEIKVNTRKKGEKYEVYHLDESSIQLGLNMESEFPSLK